MQVKFCTLHSLCSGFCYWQVTDLHCSGYQQFFHVKKNGTSIKEDEKSLYFFHFRKVSHLFHFSCLLPGVKDKKDTVMMGTTLKLHLIWIIYLHNFHGLKMKYQNFRMLSAEISAPCSELCTYKNYMYDPSEIKHLTQYALRQVYLGYWVRLRPLQKCGERQF